MSAYWLRLLVFFTVATSVWAAAHWYVGKRLIGPWNASPKEKRRAKILLWSTFFLAPGVMFAGRALANAEWFAPIRWAAFLEMGAFFLLFMFLVFRDLALLLGDGAGKIMKRAPNPERRRFLENASNAGIIGATGLIGGWGYAEADRAPEVVEVDVPIANLPRALDGYRIAQLSDIHVGPTIKGEHLSAMVAIANGLAPDMIAVTGDLIDGYVEDMREDVAPLGDLSAPDGVYFCTGNHEYYWDAEAWTAEVTRLGLRVLLNEHVLVERDDAKLLVAGCTDYSAHRIVPEAKSDPVAAKEGAPPHGRFDPVGAPAQEHRRGGSRRFRSPAQRSHARGSVLSRDALRRARASLLGGPRKDGRHLDLREPWYGVLGPPAAGGCASGDHSATSRPRLRSRALGATPMRHLLLVLLIACSVDAPARAPEPAAEPPPIEVPPPPTPMQAQGVPTADSPVQNAKQVTVNELTRRLQQFAAIMNEMKEKAREAAAAAGTECEKSFASITAAVEVSQRTTAELGRRPPEWIIAPRAQYLQLCGSLPEDAQRCSRFDYRIDNDDACGPVMDGLSDEQKAAINQMSRRVRN